MSEFLRKGHRLEDNRNVLVSPFLPLGLNAVAGSVQLACVFPDMCLVEYK